ncbi:hypothetical protein Drorol1_Dr00019469 [Drosera rotundifolia]
MVVEVMKVRTVTKENNSDKDLEEETKEMMMVEGTLRMEVVMVGVMESELEMVVVKHNDNPPKSPSGDTCKTPRPEGLTSSPSLRELYMYQ